MYIVILYFILKHLPIGVLFCPHKNSSKSKIQMFKIQIMKQLFKMTQSYDPIARGLPTEEALVLDIVVCVATVSRMAMTPLTMRMMRAATINHSDQPNGRESVEPRNVFPKRITPIVARTPVIEQNKVPVIKQCMLQVNCVNLMALQIMVRVCVCIFCFFLNGIVVQSTTAYTPSTLLSLFITSSSSTTRDIISITKQPHVSYINSIDQQMSSNQLKMYQTPSSWTSTCHRSVPCRSLGLVTAGVITVETYLIMLTSNQLKLCQASTPWTSTYIIKST